MPIHSMFASRLKKEVRMTCQILQEKANRADVQADFGLHWIWKVWSIFAEPVNPT